MYYVAVHGTWDMPEAVARTIIVEDKMRLKAAVSNIEDLSIQKRAFVSLIGLNVFSKYIKEQGITTISEDNPYSDMLMIKDFDLAGLIIENNIKIAVRTFVGNIYKQICLPESHFSNDIAADIYVGIRIDASGDNADILGFIEICNIDRQNSGNKYISIDINKLRPIAELKQAIYSPDIIRNHQENSPENPHFSEDHEKVKGLFFAYLEERIPFQDKEFFVRHISSCADCCKVFNDIIELDNIIKSSILANKTAEFNTEENTDLSLPFLSGDPLLFGREVGLNIEENSNEFLFNDENIDKEASQQAKRYKKYDISGKNIKRAISSAGKLALIGGAIYSGHQAALALQAVGVSAVMGKVGAAVGETLIQNCADGFNSLSEHFNDGFSPDAGELFDLFEGQNTDVKSLNENESSDDFVATDLMEEGLSLYDNNKRMFEILEDQEPEFFNLHEEKQEKEPSLFEEIQHHDLSKTLSDLTKIVENPENEEEDSLGDVEVISDVDNVDSFDDVEVVEYLDWLDLDKMKESEQKEESVELDYETINTEELEKESYDISENKIEYTKFPYEISLNKEILIDEMYKNVESIPEEYKGLKFEHTNENQELDKEELPVDFVNFDVAQVENKEPAEGRDLNIYIDNEFEEDLPKNKLNMKTAAGIAAAGIAVTLAVALWINNKAVQNASVLKNDSGLVNSSAPILKSDAINNKNFNGTATENGETSRENSSAGNVEEVPVNRDLRANLENTFTRRTYEVDIRNISWEIPANMAENVTFKNYIMVTGQALKSALARNLASAREGALTSQMEINTVMDTNGNVLETNITQSSGSNEVDQICLDTFKNTLQFTKLPRINAYRDRINTNLIISF